MQLQNAAGVGAAICGAIGAAICGAICGAIGCATGCGIGCGGAGCRAGCCMGGVAPGTSHEMYGGSGNFRWPLPSWQNIIFASKVSVHYAFSKHAKLLWLELQRQKSLRQAAPVPAVPSSVFLSCALKVAWSRSMDPRLRKLGHVIYKYTNKYIQYI